MTKNFAMKTISGLTAAVLVCGLGFSALAQEKKVTPPAKTEKTEKKTEKTPKPPSECNPLDEAACKAKSTCSWIAAGKTSAGKDRKAYCRTKAKAKPKPKAEK